MAWKHRSVRNEQAPNDQSHRVPKAVVLAGDHDCAGGRARGRHPTHAGDAAQCRELERRYEIIKSDISSPQLNLALFSATDKGCEPLVRRLLDAGASILSRDRLGAMPLARAARFGQLALVDLFLELGAPIDARSVAGNTALYTAAEHDRLAVVRRLLDKGADPNLPGRTGVTPLGAAAFMGNARIVDHLLVRGADANVVDRTGKAPILYAAGLGYAPIVRRLLDTGIDVNAKYGNDLTALMWAAGYSEGSGALNAEGVVTLLHRSGRNHRCGRRSRPHPVDDRGRVRSPGDRRPAADGAVRTARAG